VKRAARVQREGMGWDVGEIFVAGCDAKSLRS
jgi:hypothetical protein